MQNVIYDVENAPGSPLRTSTQSLVPAAETRASCVCDLSLSQATPAGDDDDDEDGDDDD